MVVFIISVTAAFASLVQVHSRWTRSYAATCRFSTRRFPFLPLCKCDGVSNKDVNLRTTSAAFSSLSSQTTPLSHKAPRFGLRYSAYPYATFIKLIRMG
jgi:hypothetical protein